MRTCTHCGAVAPEGSVFCPVCGTALPLEAQPAADTAAEAGPAEASAAQPAEAAPSAEDAGAAPVTEPGPAPAAPTADAAAASSPANVPAVPAADASVGAPAPFVPADAAPAAAAPAAVPPVYGGQSFGAGYSAPQQPAANSCAAPQQPAYGGYAAPQGGAVPPVYGGQPAGAGYTAQQPAANPYAVPQQPAANPYAVPQQPAANPYAVPQQPAANPYAVPQQPAADDAALRSAGYGAFIAALSSQRMLILNALLSASALCTLFSLIASGKSNAGIAVGAVVYYALTLAAPWWMYLAARKTAVNGGAYDTGGLTMYKVLMTIGFIVSWVAVGIYLIILLFAGSMLPSILQSAYQEAGSYGTDLSTLSGVVGVMVVFVLLLLAGMTVLTVFMFLKLRRTLNALLCSARTGLPTAFVSQFLIVLNYIFGVFAAISAVGALFSAFSLGLPGLFTLVSCVCSTVYMFLLADGMKTYQRQCQAIWQSFGLLPYMT